MNYRIIDTDGTVYGLFPTKILASLALKGILTFMDHHESFRIERL